jgi:hypothetical protein
VFIAADSHPVSKVKLYPVSLILPAAITILDHLDSVLSLEFRKRYQQSVGKQHFVVA